MTYKLLSLTFAFFLIIQTAINAQVPETEKAALIDLYTATQGDSWAKKWDLKKPVEKWYGVELIGNHVVGLILYENNLVGTIPPSIANLKKLEVLDVALNTLQGELPSELTELSELKVLRLEMNGMTGNLPENFTAMVNLEEFIAFKNNFEGSIPESIAEAKKLRILDVSYNHLDGNLPGTMATMVNLKKLDVSGNSLDGEIGISFGRLQKLTEISLSFNSFTGKVPSGIASLAELQTIHLQGNTFDSFENLKDMQSAYIEDFETDDLHLNLKHNELDGNYRLADTKFEDENK